MRYELNKRPKNPIILEGFPGFGLVSTIATEYLLNHLNAEKIGKFVIEEIPPTVAVQKGVIIEPVGIFYVKKYNLVILHSLTPAAGIEWGIADLVVKLGKELKAKEILCIEGIGSMSGKNNAFFISNKDSLAAKISKKTGMGPLKDGIIMGVTGALILHKTILTNGFFVETHSNLPDSRAAARMVEILDKYLGLKVDPKPLLKQAEEVETKIKDLVEKGKEANSVKQRKELSYLG